MQLYVPFLKGVNVSSMPEVSDALDKGQRHPIEQLPWQQFSYRPHVSFSIAHTGDRILLKYFVQEKTVRVAHHTDNSPVHEDSCVEFFIAFDNEENYYNLEFNCEGFCLFGFGKNVSQRELIDVDVIRKIKRKAVIENNINGNNVVHWELTLMIPVKVFIYHKIDSLKNQHCRANFYKCGDKLPEPHFLSWQNIKSATPDFHSSEFFGDLIFE